MRSALVLALALGVVWACPPSPLQAAGRTCRGCRKDLYAGQYVYCDGYYAGSTKTDCDWVGGPGCTFPRQTGVGLQQCQDLCAAEPGCMYYTHYSFGVCNLHLMTSCTQEGSSGTVYSVPCPPTPAPTPPGAHCQDRLMMKDGEEVAWHSSADSLRSCDWYASNGHCETLGSADRNEYVAKEACCMCGGGKALLTEGYYERRPAVSDQHRVEIMKLETDHSDTHYVWRNLAGEKWTLDAHPLRPVLVPDGAPFPETDYSETRVVGSGATGPPEYITGPFGEKYHYVSTLIARRQAVACERTPGVLSAAHTKMGVVSFEKADPLPSSKCWEIDCKGKLRLAFTEYTTSDEVSWWHLPGGDRGSHSGEGLPEDVHLSGVGARIFFDSIVPQSGAGKMVMTWTCEVDVPENTLPVGSHEATVHSPEEVQFGGKGLVGEKYGPLEVTFNLASPASVADMATDPAVPSGYSPVVKCLDETSSFVDWAPGRGQFCLAMQVSFASTEFLRDADHGVRIEFQTGVPETTCTEVGSGTFGETSEVSHLDYTNNENRCWTIACPGLLEMRWVEGSLGSGDYVLWSNLDSHAPGGLAWGKSDKGLSYKKSDWGVWGAGGAPAHPQTLFGNGVYLHFFSDGSGTGRGFRMSYTCRAPFKYVRLQGSSLDLSKADVKIFGVDGVRLDASRTDRPVFEVASVHAPIRTKPTGRTTGLELELPTASAIGRVVVEYGGCCPEGLAAAQLQLQDSERRTLMEHPMGGKTTETFAVRDVMRARQRRDVELFTHLPFVPKTRPTPSSSPFKDTCPVKYTEPGYPGVLETLKEEMVKICRKWAQLDNVMDRYLHIVQSKNVALGLIEKKLQDALDVLHSAQAMLEKLERQLDSAEDALTLLRRGADFATKHRNELVAALAAATAAAAIADELAIAADVLAAGELFLNPVADAAAAAADAYAVVKDAAVVSDTLALAVAAAELATATAAVATGLTKVQNGERSIANQRTIVDNAQTTVDHYRAMEELARKDVEEALSAYRKIVEAVRIAREACKKDKDDRDDECEEACTNCLGSNGWKSGLKAAYESSCEDEGSSGAPGLPFPDPITHPTMVLLGYADYAMCSSPPPFSKYPWFRGEPAGKRDPVIGHWKSSKLEAYQICDGDTSAARKAGVSNGAAISCKVWGKIQERIAGCAGTKSFYVGISSSKKSYFDGVKSRWNAKYKKLGYKYMAIVWKNDRKWGEGCRRAVERVIDENWTTDNAIGGGGGRRGSGHYAVYIAWK